MSIQRCRVRRSLLIQLLSSTMRHFRRKTTLPKVEETAKGNQTQAEKKTKSSKLAERVPEEFYRDSLLKLSMPEAFSAKPASKSSTTKKSVVAYRTGDANFEDLTADVYGPVLKASPDDVSLTEGSFITARGESKPDSSGALIFGTTVAKRRLMSLKSTRGRGDAARGTISEIATEPIHVVVRNVSHESDIDDMLYGPPLGSQKPQSTTATLKITRGIVLSESRQTARNVYNALDGPKVPIRVVQEKTVSSIGSGKSPADNKSKLSEFQFVELKREGDLKALPQAPMMNKLRPNYLDEWSNVTLAGAVALKICPEALLGQPLAPEKYPAVTTILDVTMPPDSRARLDQWKGRKAAELGLEGFKLYQQNIFADGEGFHTAVEKVLNGIATNQVTVPDRNKGHWQSLKTVFRDISDVVSVEERLNHPFLCYKGIADCVVSLNGQPSLVEWKTSSTRKDTAKALFDNPVQVAAYLGAVNFDHAFSERKLQISNGAVVVAYESGDPASVVRFDYNLMRSYWALWLQRLHQYWRLATIEKSLPKRKE